MIKVGQKVKDSISGFSGIATGRCEYLHGCVKVLIDPCELKDGTVIPGVWFDEQQVDVDSTSKVGGPMPTPPSVHP